MTGDTCHLTSRITNQRTRNLRAVQILLGHSKLESTVLYLGIELDDALKLSEQTEIWMALPKAVISVAALWVDHPADSPRVPASILA